MKAKTPEKIGKIFMIICCCAAAGLSLTVGLFLFRDGDLALLDEVGHHDDGHQDQVGERS